MSKPTVSAAAAAMLAHLDLTKLHATRPARAAYVAVHELPGDPVRSLRDHVAAAIDRGTVRTGRTGWHTFEVDGFSTFLCPDGTFITGHAAVRKPLTLEGFAALDTTAVAVSPRAAATIAASDPTLTDPLAVTAWARSIVDAAIAKGAIKLGSDGTGRFRADGHQVVVDPTGHLVIRFTAAGPARSLQEITMQGFGDLTIKSKVRQVVRRTLGLGPQGGFDDMVRTMLAAAVEEALAGGFYQRGRQGSHAVRFNGIVFRLTPDGRTLFSAISAQRADEAAAAAAARNAA